LGNCRDGLKFDELGLEILTIALPAALALAADPIASLVDTAFVGHLGTSFSILILAVVLMGNIGVILPIHTVDDDLFLFCASDDY